MTTGVLKGVLVLNFVCSVMTASLGTGYDREPSATSHVGTRPKVPTTDKRAGFSLMGTPQAIDRPQEKIILGIAEPSRFAFAPIGDIERRFSSYSRIGVKSIRSGVSWADIESTKDHWRPPSNDNYMSKIVAAGFRLNLNVTTLGFAPAWFWRDNPSAEMKDAEGRTQHLMPSYWFPGLRAVSHAATARIISDLAASGLLEHVDLIFPSYGAAEEPLYPTAGYLKFKPSFWFYDANAQTDFVRKMRQKFATIGEANSEWNTHYPSWESLEPPQPGQGTEALWRDVLRWYRDVKRDFVDWQVTDTLATLKQYNAPKTKVALMVPGSHLSEAEMDEVARHLGVDSTTGSRFQSVVAQIDTDWEIELAHRTGAVMHVTSLPNTEELQFIRAYELGKHYEAGLISAENVGHVDGVPSILSNEVLSHGLIELDQIDATDFFEPDGVTTSPTYNAYAVAYRDLLGKVNGDAPMTQTYPAKIGLNIITSGCLTLNSTKSLRICLSATAQLQVVQGASVLWSSPSAPQRCVTDVPWVKGCHAVWQGDGHLVVYNGDAPIWGVGGPSATLLEVSAKAPYLALLDTTGLKVWDTGVVSKPRRN